MSKDKKKRANKHLEISPGTNLNSDTQKNDKSEREEDLERIKGLEASLRMMADFRFNTITRFPEWRKKGALRWKRMDDYTLNSIVRSLKKKGLTKVYKGTVSNLLESSFSPKVNPIQEYFRKLKPFTGDPINQMVATIQLSGLDENKEQKKQLFKSCFTKWLVGTVANVFLEDKCANQLCFILAGPQGTFKSTWIRNLCPPALLDYYVEGSLDPDNKDSMLATATNFIYNLDDYFAGITSRKINEFKGLLTKNTIKVRRPYTRYAEELPKISSFIASSNEAQFLHDPTGSRRFLPFEIERIDIQKAKEIDIDQLWAQAYQLYKNGFIYWLESENQLLLTNYNEQFEVQSSEYELLVTYMYPPGDGETADAELTNAEILVHLQNKVSIKLSSKKVGEALRKANFPRIQKRRNNARSWVYQIIYAEEADIYVDREPNALNG